MDIFVHRNNEQLGPFSEAEIKARLAAGELAAEDHVWWSEQHDWVPLSQSSLWASLHAPVPEVYEHSASIDETHLLPSPAPRPVIEPEPEPEPEPQPEPKPVAQKRSTSRSSSSRAKGKSPMGWVIGIIVAVLVLGGLAYYFLGTDSGPDFNSSLTSPGTPQPFQVTAPNSDQSPSVTPTAAPSPEPAPPTLSPNSSAPDPSASATPPAPDTSMSPMPTPMATAPRLSLPPQPMLRPASDPQTNAAPPIAPSTPNP
jgi:hypothetical protein